MKDINVRKVIELRLLNGKILNNVNHEYLIVINQLVTNLLREFKV
jgi:hypothetical protein